MVCSYVCPRLAGGRLFLFNSVTHLFLQCEFVCTPSTSGFIVLYVFHRWVIPLDTSRSSARGCISLIKTMESFPFCNNFCLCCPFVNPGGAMLITTRSGHFIYRLVGVTPSICNTKPLWFSADAELARTCLGREDIHPNVHGIYSRLYWPTVDPRRCLRRTRRCCPRRILCRRQLFAIQVRPVRLCYGLVLGYPRTGFADFRHFHPLLRAGFPPAHVGEISASVTFVGVQRLLCRRRCRRLCYCWRLRVNFPKTWRWVRSTTVRPGRLEDLFSCVVGE